MAKWTAFPHDATDYSYDTAALKKHWVRLHAGDAEPMPSDAKVLRRRITCHPMALYAAFCRVESVSP